MKHEQTAPPSSTFKSVKEIEAQARTRMDKVLVDLQHEMASIRTGRASIGLLDSVRVDYYGSPVPPKPSGAIARAGAGDDYGAALGRFNNRPN